MNCPRCGHENKEGDRFCANCGARLTPVAPPRETTTEPVPVSDASPEELPPSPPPARPSIPPPVTPSFATENHGDAGDVDDEWRMSSLGPPPQKKRRIWLWIIVAMLAIGLIACCSFLFFVTATDTGQEWLSDFATQVSEEATKQAQ